MQPKSLLGILSILFYFQSFAQISDYNGSSSTTQLFFSDMESNVTGNEEEESIIRTIRLEFNSVEGQSIRRELLLGFSDITSDDYDYGYEAYNTDVHNDDLYLELDGEYLVIQAYGPITSDKVVPLILKTSGDYNYKIHLTQIDHIDVDQEVYLRDNLTDTYFNLRQDLAYTFTSTDGVFDDRFEIVFQSENLSTEDIALVRTLIYFNNNSDMLFVKGLNTEVSKLTLINMLGQAAYTKTNVSSNTLENGLPINELATGIYIVSIKTEDNQTIDKKIVID